MQGRRPGQVAQVPVYEACPLYPTVLLSCSEESGARFVGRAQVPC